MSSLGRLPMVALWLSSLCLAPQALAATVPYYLATGMQPLVAGASQEVLAFTNAGIAYGGATNGFDPYAFAWGGTSHLVDSFHSQNLSMMECRVSDASASGLLVGTCHGQAMEWTPSGAVALSNAFAPVAVNNQGWVVGGIGGAINGSSVLWRPGVGLSTLGSSFIAADLNNQGLFAGAAGGMAALGSFAPDGSFLGTTVWAGPGSALTAVNDQGLFVGNDASGRSFMGSVHGTTQQLVLPAGYSRSVVWDVNSSGVAVGVVSDGSLYQGQILTNKLAVWQGGTVRLLDVRNLLSQYSSPYQKATAVPTFFNLHINDNGQIALNGLVNGVDTFGYLLNPCQRCGQIKPNPNPDANIINVAPDWEQATNGEDFDNQGQIALSTFMDNTGSLSTSAAGAIAIFNAGHLVNSSRMSFADSSATPYGHSLLVHLDGIFEVTPSGSVVHAGTTWIGQAGTVLIDGVWNAHSGAQLQVLSGGTLSVRERGIFSNQQGAILQVQSNGAAAFAKGSNLINFGNVSIEGGTVKADGALFNGAGATINISGTGSRAGQFTSAASGMENFGRIVVLAGGQFNVEGQVLSHAGSAIHTLTDDTGDGHLTIASSGNLVFDAGSNAFLYGQPVSLQGAIHSAGYIHFASGIDSMGPSSNLVNESRGAMNFDYAPEIHGRFSMYGGSQTLVSDLSNNPLVNQGLITLDDRETRLNALSNGLTVWSYTGNILPTTASFYSGIVNNPGGTVQVLNGAALLVGSQGLTNAGGQVLIDGRSDLSATRFDTTAFRQWDGALEVNGTMDVTTFDCVGGSVSGTGRINTSGDFGISHGCTLSPGSGLIVNGASLGPSPQAAAGAAKLRNAAVRTSAGPTASTFAPGTLTLSGNVTFNNVEFAMAVSDAGASKLVIDGTAQFNGGVLRISFLEGAMADPDALLELFGMKNCNNCGLGTLGVVIEGSDPNWTGTVHLPGASGAVSVSVDNAAALNLELSGTIEQVLAASTTVYNRYSAQLDAGHRLLNDGAFYNRTGADLTLAGDFVNRSGGQVMNHGWMFNIGSLTNEFGAVFNNRGTILNSGLSPAASMIVNRGLFINLADGRIDNGSSAPGQIVNEGTGRFVNRGLITNNTAYSQLQDVGGAWFVNRGVLENHGSMISSITGLVLNDGGRVIIHDTGLIQTGGYRQTVSSLGNADGQAPAETVVNGLLEVAGDIALDGGTRLSGTGTAVGRVVGGVIAPGDPTGTLHIDGSVLYSDLDVLFDGTGHGRLSVSGDVNLSTVSLRLASDFDALTGHHYTWLTAGSAPNQTTGVVTFWTQGAAGDWSSAAMQTLNGRSFWTLTLASGPLFAVMDPVQSSDGSLAFSFELVGNVAAVPEPPAAMLIAIGLLCLAPLRRRAR